MAQTEILNTIYQLRTLSKEQIIHTFFPKDANNNRGNTYGDKVLRDMIKSGIIEKRKVLDKTYYQTTTKGNIRAWDSITVLFLQKTTRSIQRKETIIKSIQDTISDLTDGVQFNIRIGSETELFEWFYKEMIRKYMSAAVCFI